MLTRVLSRLLRIGFMKKILFFSILILSFSASAQEPEAEIQALISSLDSCKNCVFIRNGSEHKVPEAKAHLLRKYEAAKKQIHSAEDFILGVASKSSITGTPYKIKTADGKEVESEKWLFDRLKEIRAKSPKK